MDGPNPLTFTDIANWTALTGEIVSRDEIAIIRAIDGAYLTAVAQEQAEQRERSKAEQNGRS